MFKKTSVCRNYDAATKLIFLLIITLTVPAKGSISCLQVFNSQHLDTVIHHFIESLSQKINNGTTIDKLSFNFKNVENGFKLQIKNSEKEKLEIHAFQGGELKNPLNRSEIIGGYEALIGIHPKLQKTGLGTLLYISMGMKLTTLGFSFRSTPTLSSKAKLVWQNLVSVGLARRRFGIFRGKEVEYFEFDSSGLQNSHYDSFESHFGLLF